MQPQVVLNHFTGSYVKLKHRFTQIFTMKNDVPVIFHQYMEVAINPKPKQPKQICPLCQTNSPIFFFSYIPHPLLELCLVSPFAIVCPAPGISSHKSLPSSLTFYNLDILTFAHSHPRASFLHTYQLVCNPIIPVYNLSYSHTYACVLPSF